MTPLIKGEIGSYNGGPIIRAGTAPRIYIDEGADDRTAVALVKHLKDGGVEVMDMRVEDPQTAKAHAMQLAEAMRRHKADQQDRERAAWNASVDAQRRAKGKDEPRPYEKLAQALRFKP